MLYYIKCLFGAFALFTLSWIYHTPPGSVNFVAWVTLIQSPDAKLFVFVLSAIILFFDEMMTGILAAQSWLANKVRQAARRRSATKQR